MQQPTLSARAAGRHSTTVDHAARLPAQRSPWRSHGSHKQLCSPLHAARQHGLGPLVVGAFRPLPCLTRCEFADGSFNSVGPIVAAATLSVGPTAPDAVRGRQVVLRLHGHTYGTSPVTAFPPKPVYTPGPYPNCSSHSRSSAGSSTALTFSFTLWQVAWPLHTPGSIHAGSIEHRRQLLSHGTHWGQCGIAGAVSAEAHSTHTTCISHCSQKC